jgi:hypothetical protein
VLLGEALGVGAGLDDVAAEGEAVDRPVKAGPPTRHLAQASLTNHRLPGTWQHGLD